MQKVFIVVALVGVLVSGPASADEFPPGMDWLMNKPLSFWDWGIYQYDNNQHESAKKKLSWMLGGKKVSGGFMWWDTDLRANYFVYEVKGNLNNRCLEIWALAKETVWPKHDQQSKKHGMKSFGDSLAFNFTPRSYIFRDQPKTLGRSLADLFYVDVHVYREPEMEYEGELTLPYPSERATCTGHIFDDKPRIKKRRMRSN